MIKSTKARLHSTICRSYFSLPGNIGARILRVFWETIHSRFVKTRIGPIQSLLQCNRFLTSVGPTFLTKPPTSRKIRRIGCQNTRTIHAVGLKLTLKSGRPEVQKTQGVNKRTDHALIYRSSNILGRKIVACKQALTHRRKIDCQTVRCAGLQKRSSVKFSLSRKSH